MKKITKQIIGISVAASMFFGGFLVILNSFNTKKENSTPIIENVLKASETPTENNLITSYTLTASGSGSTYQPTFIKENSEARNIITSASSTGSIASNASGGTSPSFNITGVLKLGTASASGSVTYTLDDKINNICYVEVKALGWNTSAKMNFSFNSESPQTVQMLNSPSGMDPENPDTYTFSTNGNSISSITIANQSERLIVFSIAFYSHDYKRIDEWVGGSSYTVGDYCGKSNCNYTDTITVQGQFVPDYTDETDGLVYGHYEANIGTDETPDIKETARGSAFKQNKENYPEYDITYLIENDIGLYATAYNIEDPSNVIKDRTTVEKSNVLPADCVNAGSYDLTGYFENPMFGNEGLFQKHIIVSAYGHAHNVQTAYLALQNAKFTYDEDGLFYKSATFTSNCGRGCGDKITETVYPTHEILTAPTCCSKGLVKYTWAYEEGGFFASIQGLITTMNFEIPVDENAHNYSDVSYNWSSEGGSLSCRASVHCQIEGCGFSAEEFGQVTFVEDTPATCTEPSKGHYEATFENPLFTTSTYGENVTNPSDPEPLGHNYLITYTYNEDYSACSARAVCQNPNCESIIEENDVSTSIDYDVYATDVNIGTGNLVTHFTNEIFQNNKEQQTYIEYHEFPMLDHHEFEPTEDFGEETDDNGIITGIKAYFRCKGCGAEEKEDIIVTSTITKQPTCQEEGTIHYEWTYKSNIIAELMEPLFGREMDNILPVNPNGHVYSAQYSWNGSTCTAIVRCTCVGCTSDRISLTGTGTYVEDTPATCTTKSKGHYEATFASSFLTATASNEANTVESGNILGHSYGEPTYVWNGSTCTATISCTREGCEEKITEEASESAGQVTFVQDTPATCKDPSKGHYVATFFNESFIDQTTETNSATRGRPSMDHNYQATNIQWNGSRVTAVIYCDVCENSFNLSASGSFITDTPATCTEPEKGHYEAMFSDAMFSQYVESERNSATNGYPLGHSYGIVTFSWDGDQCTATVRCTREGCDNVDTYTVTGTYVEDTPATCTTKSKGHYFVSIVNPTRFKGITATAANTAEYGDPLGHTWGTPTYDWDQNLTSVTATITCQVTGCNGKETETVQLSSQITQNQSCENDELTTYTAQFTNSLFTTQTKDNIKTKNALGHSYGEPTYVWNGSTCTATVSCTRDGCEHSIIEEASESLGKVSFKQDTPATCKDASKGHYEATFSSEYFSTQRTEANSATRGQPSLNHNYQATNVQWNGSRVTAVIYCNVCGNSFTLSASGSFITDTPATCTNPAKGHYEAMFDNAMFTQYVESERNSATNGNPLGHSYGSATFTWDGDQCTATVTCTREGCVNVDTHTVTGTYVEDTPATCTTKSKGHYVASIVDPTQFKGTSSTAANTAEYGDPLGHTWGTISYDWNGDLTKVTATRTCQVTGCNGKETETVDVSSQITQNQTCENDELTTYTAEFNNPAFTTQTKDNIKTKDALGHDWSNAEYTWSPDNSSVAASRVCLRDGCDKEETELVSTSSVITQNQNCENDELTTYTAEFNNPSFSTQTKVDVKTKDALGHDWNEPTYVWSQDKSSVTATRTCKRDGCKGVETEIAASSSQIIQEQTCEDVELTNYTAEFNNPAFTTQYNTNNQTKDILGHDWANPTYVWNVDNSSVTATRTCKREGCNGIETETVQTSSQITQNQTCEDVELATYTAEFSNPAFSTQTKADVQTKDMLGHDWSLVEYIWNEDQCTATRTCNREGCKGIETETKTATYVKDTSATCENDETGHFEVTFDNTNLGSCNTIADSVIVNESALGHNWSLVDYSWDGDTCTATRTCTRLSCDKTETETVKGTYVKDTDATCLNNETGHYEVTFVNPAFAAQSTEIDSFEVLETALGHNWASPEYSWDGDTCIATRGCTHSGCTETESETVKGTYVKDSEADCETNEKGHYEVSFVNDAFAAQSTENNSFEVIGTALGHDFNEPTYSWNENICTATRSCTRDGCNKVESEAVTGNYVKDTDALCESSEYGHYNVTFVNPAFIEQKTDDNSYEVPDSKLGHDYKIDYDWNINGLTATVTATAVCSHDSTHAYTEVVAASYKETKAATCENDGIGTFTVSFKNSLFSTQTENIVLTKLGHDYETNKPTYTWSKSGSNYICTAQVICAKDSSHVLTEQVVADYNIISKEDCENNGLGRYTATFKNSLFSQQDKDEVRPAYGHDYVINYEWTLIGDVSCVAKATCKNDPSHVITEQATLSYVIDVKNSCLTDGQGTYTATFKNSLFSTQTKSVVIVAHGHEYSSDWSYDIKPTKTNPGEKSHHCIYCDDRIDITFVEALTPDDAKDSAKDIIQPSSEEEKEKIEEALEKIPEETIVEISDIVNTEKNTLDEALQSGEITEQEYERRVEIVQVVTEQVVLLAGNQEETVSAGDTLTESIPEDSGLDMGQIFDDFYARQIAILLGKEKADAPLPQNVVGPQRRMANEDTGVDYSIGADEYAKIGAFVDTSVQNMSDAALTIRECSGEKVKQSVKDYITKVSISSFRDFDKEAADNEFVENAYNAILLNMQQQVLSSLETEHAANKSFTPDPAKEDLYKQQVEAVSDIETFEIMVLEVLRQKYVSLTGEEISLEDFDPVYRTIFRHWCLNEEQDVDITLEQLTNAVITTTNNQATTITVNSSLTALEIAIIIIFVGLFIALIIGAIVVTYGINRRRKF